jgi:hemerythrin-like domain-containing protein
MLRDKNLIPLSHQHQHALALCVRIDRAQPIPGPELQTWLDEIEREFANEIKIHFSAEESVLFPAACNFPELLPLVKDLIADHAALREFFSQTSSHTLSASALSAFARQLSVHIRKEERQLFERVQQLMSATELSQLGEQLGAALKDAVQSCSLPTEATKLKPKK